MTQSHYSLGDTAKLTLLLQNPLWARYSHGPRYLTHKPVPLMDMLQPIRTFLCFGIFKTSFFFLVISSVNLYEVLCIFPSTQTLVTTHVLWAQYDVIPLKIFEWLQVLFGDRTQMTCCKKKFTCHILQNLFSRPHIFFLKIWLHETSSRLRTAEELCCLRNKYQEIGPSG